MRVPAGFLAAALILALAGCGATQVEEAAELVTESPEEQFEREGREAVEPDTGEPKRDANWVVGTVAEVSTDFKQVILKVPAESDIVTGDVFTIYRNYRDLPASKYLHTHDKQLYLGKAQVTAAGGQAAQAKILHRVTENPIKVGDSAIAKVF